MNLTSELSLNIVD